VKSSTPAEVEVNAPDELWLTEIVVPDALAE
jgi:hypothetical protein